MSKIAKTIIDVKMYPDRLMKATAKKKRGVLFGLGGYTRKVLRSMFKTKDKPSRPGYPPNVRDKNSPLRSLVVFSVDVAQGLMVCGPKLFDRSSVKSSDPLPHLLDGGGEITFESFGEPVTVDVAPRPFRAKAQAKAQGHFFKLLETEPL